MCSQLLDGDLMPVRTLESLLPARLGREVAGAWPNMSSSISLLERFC